MITRAQIRRQLRKEGGIMNAVPRQKYLFGGVGDFFGDVLGKAGKVAKKVVKSPIGKAALLGLGAYGLGGGFGPGRLANIGARIGGSGIGQFFKGMGPKLFGTAAGSAAGPMSYLQKGVQQFTPGILGKLGITGGGGAMGLTGKGMLAGGAGLLSYFMSKGKTEEEAKGLMQDVKRGSGMGLDIIKADMQKYRSGDLSESQAYNKGYHFLPQKQYMQAATGGRVGLYAGTPEEEIKSLDAGASSIKREGDVYPMDDDTTTQMYISDELGALPKKEGGVLPEDMGKLTITDFESKEDYNRYLRILHQGTRESLEENLPSQEDIKRFIPEDVLEERAQGGRIGFEDGTKPEKYIKKRSRISKNPFRKRPSYKTELNPEYTEWKKKKIDEIRYGKGKKLPGYRDRANPVPIVFADGGRIGKYGGGIGATMPRIPTGMPRVNAGGITELDYRAGGGFVPVGVKEKADDVPAMLSKNEFVMTADAVKAAGGGSVEKGAQKMYDTMKRLEGRIA
jgi:hypothetical protein